MPVGWSAQLTPTPMTTAVSPPFALDQDACELGTGHHQSFGHLIASRDLRRGGLRHRVVGRERRDKRKLRPMFRRR